MRLTLRQDAARVALAGLAFLILASPAAATTLPAGFEERTLAAGLSGPTDVAWAPDGRMFVAEKAGRVRVVGADGTLRPLPLVDVSSHVNAYADRGLIGIAVDKDFASNGYLYLLYTYETEPGNPAGPKSSRMTRVVVKPDNTVANPSSPETVVLGTASDGQCPAPSNTVDCLPSDSYTHSIGTVRADSDGTLWVGSGDGAGASVVDSLAFQTYDERTYRGKILHVDRDGRGLPGHPFCPSDTNLDHVCTKVYAKGFRNPFRFTLRPGKTPLVGDVGWHTREELDVLTPGGDYGWPCYEGTIRTPSYSNDSRCKPELARERTAQAARSPVYDYPHEEGTSAIVAGPVYEGSAYPAAYHGSLFIGDYAKGTVRRLTLNGSDRLSGPVQGFGSDWWGGVSLEAAPNGDLASVYFGDGSYGTGSVAEIAYSPGNATPIARASADPRYGAVPLEVHFRGADSTDPDHDTLSYDWSFGDGSAHSSAANPVHSYANAGDYIARLTVDDGRGRSASATVHVSAGNSPPSPTIAAPADGALYRDGVYVNLAGSATDPEEGSLPDSALSWHVQLIHVDHLHPVADLPGSHTSFRPFRDHDANAFYEVTLTATDSHGLTGSRKITLRPKLVKLGLKSSPAGAPLSYGGEALTAPYSGQTAVGFETSISAAERFETGGRTYEFDHWSDGGDRLHDVAVTDSGVSLVAVYRDVTPPTTSVTPSTGPPPTTPPDDSGDGPAPLLSFSTPRSGLIRSLKGTVRDRRGMRRVWIALRHRGSKVSRSGVRACRWWSRRRGRLVMRGCERPVWLRARLKRSGRHRWTWRVSLGKRLPSGRYKTFFRAVDAEGNVARGLAGGSRR